MLTRLQRQSGPCLTDRYERQAYRTHMCGLCYALGDKYGLLSRLLTTRETILLNLLTNAQCRKAPANVVRRCPLNPLRTVTTNRDMASRSTSVELANLSEVSFGGPRDRPEQSGLQGRSGHDKRNSREVKSYG